MDLLLIINFKVIDKIFNKLVLKQELIIYYSLLVIRNNRLPYFAIQLNLIIKIKFCLIIIFIEKKKIDTSNTLSY